MQIEFARIFCTYFRVNRKLSSRSPINSLQGGGLYQNIIISLNGKSQGLVVHMIHEASHTCICAVLVLHIHVCSICTCICEACMYVMYYMYVYYVVCI